MASETIIENAVCGKCGAGVRENTSFCYNCGSTIAPVEDEVPAEPVAEGPADTPEPEDRSETSAGNDKLAKAAAQRKKARVNPRRPREFRWEPVQTSGWPLLVIAVAVALVAGAIVWLIRYLR